MTPTRALTAELLDVTERMIASNRKRGTVPTHAYGLGGAQGGLYVPAALRLVATAPPGRVWVRTAWVVEGSLRACLRNSMCGLDAHSYLQEPHGGAGCGYPYMSTERVPVLERLRKKDGPRVGRGTLLGAAFVRHPGRDPLMVMGRVRECSVRADMWELLLGLPDSTELGEK